MSELKLEPIIADDVVWGKVYYEMHEVDDVIANLKAENDHLRSTTHSERDEYIDMVNAKDKEIAELKRKLEDAKASAYAESVDAGMRERRLRSALWLARAYRAEARKNYWYARSIHEGDKNLWSIDGSAVKYIGCIKRTNFDWLKTWSEVQIKCQSKAEEYK